MNFSASVDSSFYLRNSTIIKMLRVMRITALLILLSFFQVSATGVAQELVTVAGKDIPLQKVFAIIKKQSGYSFMYLEEEIEKARKVTIDLKDVPVTTVLDLCLKGQPFTYNIEGKTIFIVSKKTGQKSDEFSNIKFIDITGRVVNEAGEPVPGVTVAIKGTDITTTTNENGEFRLKSVSKDAILVFSHITMDTFEQQVSGKSEILVRLKTKIRELGGVEIIVSTGYQDLPRERATGSFVKVDNELFNRRVGSIVLDRITDVSTGLLQSNVSGLSIRGVSTINSSRTPLIIVDNFPFEGDINLLNPNDIDNVTILRDAAAASIWGVRAGNGVVVITTKKGKYNQLPKIQVNSNITISEKPDLFYIPFISSVDRIEFETAQFDSHVFDDYDDVYPLFNYFPALPSAIEIMLSARKGNLTKVDAEKQLQLLADRDIRSDLTDHFLQKAIQQQYALNISGGTEKYNYYASVGFDKGRGHSIKEQNERLSILFNNTYKLFKRLELNGFISHTINNSSNVPNFSNYLPNTSTVSPYAKLVDDNGSALPIPFDNRIAFVDTLSNPSLFDWHYRPYDELKYSKIASRTSNSRIGTGITYSFPYGLRAGIQYQFQSELMRNENYVMQKSYYLRNLVNKFISIDPATGTAEYQFPKGDMLTLSNTESRTWNLRGQLNFDRTWGLHQVSALIGTEIQEYSFEDKGDQALFGYNPEIHLGRTVDPLAMYPTYPSGIESNFGIGNDLQVSGNLRRNGSQFATFGYTFNNRYLVSGSGRIDRSNFFGVKANQREVPLWSSGIAWVISRESFFKAKWVNSLRLKSTYGYNGNTNSGASAYTTIQYSSEPPLFIPINTVYARIQTPPNPQLKWERIRIMNFGVDFEIFKRVTGNIEYYTKKGLDLIGPIALDPTSGIMNFIGNRASLITNGVDLSLNIKTSFKSLSLLSTIFLSYNKDKVLDYGNERTITSGTLIGGVDPIVGKPLFYLYSYKFGGLNSNTGDPQIVLGDSISSYDDYVDAKPEDLIYSGPKVPQFFGSFLNSVSWKNINISFNIVYRFKYFFRRSSVNYSTLYNTWGGHSDFSTRWKKPGDENYTNIPSLPINANSARDAAFTDSDVLIEKGDHIRFQDIRISYDLPKSVINRFALYRAQLYFYANNLGIIWRANNRHIDPEAISFGSMPSPKSYAIGLSLNF